MARRKLSSPSNHKTSPGLPGSSAKPGLALAPGSGNRVTLDKPVVLVGADAALRCRPSFLVLARLLARQAATELLETGFHHGATLSPKEIEG